MGNIELFAELYSSLDKRIMTDIEVDRIVNAASAMAATSKNDEQIQMAVEKIRDKATDVKNNYDYSAIEGIGNTQDLNKAIDIYNARAEKSGVHYDYTEIKLAEKLADFSEKEDSKEIIRMADKLVDTPILDGSNSETKGQFAGYLISAYGCAANNTKLTPNKARDMLGIVADLSQHTEHPADSFLMRLPLDDKKVAEDFLKHTEKALERADDNDGVLMGGALIKQYAEIVKHHPEMAKKCNELVNKTANLQGGNYLSDTYDAASKYYEKVKEMNGVSDSDKAMARTRSNIWEKKAVRTKEREEEQSMHKSPNKTTEIDFKQMDFEIER